MDASDVLAVERLIRFDVSLGRAAHEVCLAAHAAIHSAAPERRARPTKGRSRPLSLLRPGACRRRLEAGSLEKV